MHHLLYLLHSQVPEGYHLVGLTPSPQAILGAAVATLGSTSSFDPDKAQGFLYYVATGILVPVADIATDWADVLTLAEREFCASGSATVAKLAGGKEPIDFEQGSACPTHLAFQQVQKLAERGIGEREGETTVAYKSLHMQVFHPNEASGLCDLGGQFVQEILAQASNAIVQPAQLAFGLLPVFAAYCASGQFLIESAQLLQKMAQRSLVLKPPSIAQSSKPQEAHIDSHSRQRARFGHHILHLDGDGDEPPICRFADPCREDFPRETQRLRQVDTSQLRHIYPVIAHHEFVIGQIEGLAGAFLALELRIARLCTPRRSS